MKKLLSQKFYENLENEVFPRFENKSNISILRKIDWEIEAHRCLMDLTAFLGNVDIDRLKNNGIDTIGVIDICWNEYGSDIEVDFMPDNDFDAAYDEGCIMNDSAINNEDFFASHFNTNGEKAWGDIGNDYTEIILIFDYLLSDIVPAIIEQKEFAVLPKKVPCHIGFAGFHDEQRTNIFTVA
ncbi:hypothetical protein [Aquimarina litoralis]|uniref:hypothetical protein n=1 Tax=Aquimarina litoralis TaxID=584605 RepID=UPI001C562736|nr:hypothetical protein [Aquimarina litoralis]MBW1296861.1 hypothetical protein [Aquimarina litoralis]